MSKKIEETTPKIVSEAEFASSCGLETLYGTGGNITLVTANVNRPGLLFAGHSDYFGGARTQVLGKTESAFLATLSKELKLERLNNFFSKKPPCLIITRGQEVSDDILTCARSFKIPVFRTPKVTAVFVNELYLYLNELLAPVDTVHGILLDVYGVGVLITGKSGIGKSETSLELVHRGHRLVSDDVVDLKEVKSKLYGSSPRITKHMMEIRGVGILDIKAMYGVGAVLNSKKVHINIHLELWDDNKVYDRTGNQRETVEFLGVKLPKYTIPVVPGRNLAILVEVAARDFRLKQGGYNPIEELNRRME
ncbi:MAG: HPr(Ser) kinase/phosphatase [Clostridia bacterium]